MYSDATNGLSKVLGCPLAAFPDPIGDRVRALAALELPRPAEAIGPTVPEGGSCSFAEAQPHRATPHHPARHLLQLPSRSKRCEPDDHGSCGWVCERNTPMTTARQQNLQSAFTFPFVTGGDGSFATARSPSQTTQSPNRVAMTGAAPAKTGRI